MRAARIVAGDIEKTLRSSGPEGAPDGRPPKPVDAPALTLNGAKSERTVEELFHAFLIDPTRIRARKTEMLYESLKDIVIDVWGGARPLGTIDREACRTLLDVLRALPSNPTKRFPHLSALEAAKLANEAGLTSTLSAASVNGYMSKLRAVMNFAANEEWITRNPARGLRISDPVRARDKRLPFSTEQLRLIFDAPLYRGCVDDQHGYATPGTARPRRGRFWVPLIALFGGLRLNEACQLDVVDIRHISGIYCFAVTDEATARADKRLKTAMSNRIVPVHPTLAEIGFLAFVHERRRNGGAKLFPELPMSTTGYYSDPFSKWFSRFLIKAGAARPKTCFHSFRHCYRDALREAHVDREIALSLGGWRRGIEVAEPEAAYGSGFKVTTLFDAVAKIEFPDLDLSHIRTGS